MRAEKEGVAGLVMMILHVRVLRPGVIRVLCAGVMFRVRVLCRVLFRGNLIPEAAVGVAGAVLQLDRGRIR